MDLNWIWVVEDTSWPLGNVCVCLCREGIRKCVGGIMVRGEGGGAVDEMDLSWAGVVEVIIVLDIVYLNDCTLRILGECV